MLQGLLILRWHSKWSLNFSITSPIHFSSLMCTEMSIVSPLRGQTCARLSNTTYLHCSLSSRRVTPHTMPPVLPETQDYHAFSWGSLLGNGEESLGVGFISVHATAAMSNDCVGDRTSLRLLVIGSVFYITLSTYSRDLCIVAGPFFWRVYCLIQHGHKWA